MNLFQNCKLNTLEFVRNYHSIFDLSNLINHTLLNRYASSQNYYFNIEINDILSKNRTSVIIKYYVANSQIIKFYYYMQQLENKECMSRNYYLNDYQSQIQSLIQFDKYHHEIPLYPIEEDIILIFDLHYNNRSKLIYYEIKKQIEYQNLKNLDQHQKGIVIVNDYMLQWSYKRYSQKGIVKMKIIIIISFNKQTRLQHSFPIPSDKTLCYTSSKSKIIYFITVQNSYQIDILLLLTAEIQKQLIMGQILILILLVCLINFIKEQEKESKLGKNLKVPYKKIKSFGLRILDCLNTMENKSLMLNLFHYQITKTYIRFLFKQINLCMLSNKIKPFKSMQNFNRLIFQQFNKQDDKVLNSNQRIFKQSKPQNLVQIFQNQKKQFSDFKQKDNVLGSKTNGQLLGQYSQNSNKFRAHFNQHTYQIKLIQFYKEFNQTMIVQNLLQIKQTMNT